MEKWIKLIINMFLPCLYLSRKVVEAKHKSPVEVSLSSQRVEVDISLLFVVFQSFYPSKHKTENI